MRGLHGAVGALGWVGVGLGVGLWVWGALWGLGRRLLWWLVVSVVCGLVVVDGCVCGGCAWCGVCGCGCTWCVCVWVVDVYMYMCMHMYGCVYVYAHMCCVVCGGEGCRWVGWWG